MQYLQIVQERGNIILTDQRQNLRHEVYQLITITAKGTGRIIDLSIDGLSFGCLYPHTFPEKMKIDILGANGIFIKGIDVETRWENNFNPMQRTDKYEKITGLKFTGLDHTQWVKLNEIIRNIESTSLKTQEYFCPPHLGCSVQYLITDYNRPASGYFCPEISAQARLAQNCTTR